METITKSICEANMKIHDERFNRDYERLETLEKGQKDLVQLSIQMGEILKRHDEDLREAKEAQKRHEDRIYKLETKPVMGWEKLSGSVITTLGETLGGAILALILFGLAQTR